MDTTSCRAETFRQFFRNGCEVFMPSKEDRRAKKKERVKTRKEYVLDLLSGKLGAMAKPSYHSNNRRTFQEG